MATMCSNHRRRTSQSLARLAAASLLGIAAVGCGDDGNDASPPDPDIDTTTPTTGAEVGTTIPATDAPEPADEAVGCTPERIGGIVTMGVFSETAGLDPLIARGSGTAGGTEIAAIYDTLVHYDPITQELEPRVAQSIEPNDDFTEWTLTLRDDVTFGNGDPLTAEAVKWNLERHLDPANIANAVSYVGTITDMDVIDETTLVVTLDAPWGRFPSLFTTRVGSIANPNVVDERGDDFNTNPTGAGVGPFDVERFAPGEELVLRANDDYWGGPVCIEELRFVFVPGAPATYDALRAGELQVAFLRDPQTIADARAEGYDGVTSIQNAGALFMLNHSEPAPTSDLTVRQALAAGVDPAVIDERVWGGGGQPTTAVVAEASPLYDGQSGPEVDRDRATTLVEEAKAGGWDGSIELLCFDDPTTQDICITVKAMLDNVGMDVNIQTTTIQAMIEQVLVQQDYEMSVFGFNVPDSDPWGRLNGFLHSESLGNRSGYGDPAMDEALAQLRAATTLDEEQAALAAIQEAWNDTIPHIIYGGSEEFIAVDDTVIGVELRQDGIVFFDNAYVDR